MRGRGVSDGRSAGRPAPRTAMTRRNPMPAGQSSEVSREVNLSLLSWEDVVEELGQRSSQPMRFNRRGPGLAVGDLTGEGRDDIVLGGTTHGPARILLANRVGAFANADAAALETAQTVNDGPLLVFDADGDGKN